MKMSNNDNSITYRVYNRDGAENILMKGEVGIVKRLPT